MDFPNLFRYYISWHDFLIVSALEIWKSSYHIVEVIHAGVYSIYLLPEYLKISSLQDWLFHPETCIHGQKRALIFSGELRQDQAITVLPPCHTLTHLGAEPIGY